MQSQRGAASRIVPVGIVVLGAVQVALALSRGRWMGALGFGLVALVGATSVRRGMVLPDGTGWRIFCIALGIFVFGTLALALGAALLARAV
jgi:hypothetical protein